MCRSFIDENDKKQPQDGDLPSNIDILYNQPYFKKGEVEAPYLSQKLYIQGNAKPNDVKIREKQIWRY